MRGTKILTGACGCLCLVAGAGAADGAAEQAARDADDRIAEIVVTSRKREESLQDVPVAVSAFGAEDLDRLQARSSVDLSGAAPNFFMKQNPTTTVSPSLYIRGIGQDESHFTSENGVGLYVDGVYVPRASGSIVELLDLERVEVLRGPQGTLFGKNSPAGALVLTSRRPDLMSTAARAGLTVGNYDAVGGRLSVETPIVDGVLATKLDFGGRSNDGWMNDRVSGDTVNGTTKYAGRWSTLWQPSESTAVQLVLDFSKDRSQPYAPTFVAGRTPVHDLYETNVPREFNRDQQFDGRGAALTVDHEFSESLSFRSITAYRRFTHKLWGELFGARAFAVPLSRDQNQHQASQEFQLNVTRGRLNGVVGAIWFTEENREDANNAFAPGGTQYPSSRQRTDSYALFAEGTYAVTDALSLTVGGRIGTDEKTMTRRSTDQPGGAGTIVAYDVRDLEKSWTEFTPRVIVEYRPFAGGPAASVLTYASASRGYKAGAFDAAFTGDQALASFVYDPEKVTAYEVGLKGDFFERRLRANLAYFRNDYDDYQSADCTFGANSVCRPASFDITLEGFEAELTFAPTAGVRLFANVSTLDNDIESGPAQGRQLENAPELTYYVGFELERELAGEWRVFAGADRHWTDDYFNDLQNGIEGRTDAYGLVNAHLGVARGGRWSVRLWGRNLGDEAPIVNALTGGSWWIGQPRTYGLTLDFSL